MCRLDEEARRMATKIRPAELSSTAARDKYIQTIIQEIEGSVGS